MKSLTRSKVLEDIKREELLDWALAGISAQLGTARGCSMFGAQASAKIVDKTIQITTREIGVSGPVFYELRLTKPIR